MNYSIGIILGTAVFYVIGSIPFGILFVRLVVKKDLRHEGSGNIGATNATRVGGKWLGLAVFICDGLKGLLAVLVGMHFNSVAIASFVTATFIGHIFSIFLSFKGGKGVSVFVFSLFALDWRLGMVFGIVWIFIFIITKYVSVASLLGAFSSYFATCCMIVNNDEKISISTLLFVTIAVSLIVLKHISNLHRLFNGTEYRFNTKNKII